MRYLSLLAALMLCFCLTACGGESESSGSRERQPAPQTPTPETPEASETPEAPSDDAGASVSDAADDAVPVNAECLVSGKAIPTEGMRVSYNGKVYGFCCKNCVAKFKAEPEQYASK